MTTASEPGPASGSWRRLGLRREVLILLPVVLLLLVLLSLFTLFSYRNGVAALIAERRSEASLLARAVALRLAAVPAGDDAGDAEMAVLRQIEPLARGGAVLDRGGQVLLAVGEPVRGGLPRTLEARASPKPEGLGRLALDDESAGSVSGLAPLGAAAARRYVYVELPAESLAAQARALAILTPSVLVLDAALVLLALAFLRHLLAPYETLLHRARRLGASGGEGDELEFLLNTFEAAVQALSRRELEAESDLASLERTLSASLQSGLLLLDRRGDVLALNPVGSELLGVDGTVAGRPLEEVLAGEPELLGLLASAIRLGEAPARQECALRAGGRGITVGLTVHPLRRDDGEVRGSLILFADLTEGRRQADERRLADSLAQLGELAGGVAHELRNSLATLRGYLTLIERRPEEEQLADYLSEIRREADHLGRVLEDFLAFARPGSARSEVLPLGLLVERAAGDPLLAGVEVLVRDADASLATPVRVDPQLLERALRNLLHNAAHAEREAGRSGPIELTVSRAASGLEIAIEDRGKGIDREVRDRLFHPFVTGRKGGVGLGLALTQRIVVLHGGRVRLEDRPGGGARAVVTLPTDTIVTDRTDSPEAPAPAPAPDPEP
jgi:signal transduction histidine kinase